MERGKEKRHTHTHLPPKRKKKRCWSVHFTAAVSICVKLFYRLKGANIMKPEKNDHCPSNRPQLLWIIFYRSEQCCTKTPEEKRCVLYWLLYSIQGDVLLLYTVLLLGHCRYAFLGSVKTCTLPETMCRQNTHIILNEEERTDEKSPGSC